MRRKRVIGGIAGVLAGALLIGTLVFALPEVLKRKTPPVANLPEDADVEKLTASIRSTQVGFDPVPEFAVPPGHIPRILFWLRPSEYVREPPIFPEDLLGELKITTKHGEVVAVKYYWAGMNPPVFSTNGVDYFWGGGVTEEDGRGVDGGIRLGKAIVAAHAEWESKTTSK
jgi:hypothetical protein